MFNVIRRIILLVAVVVFCYSAYMLLNIYLEYKKGDDIYNHIQEQVLDNTPTTVDIPDGSTVDVPFKYDHAALLSINPDGVGFMYIPSINVQLPIVQPTDNDYYLTHTFDKTENKSGCLFEDCRITDGLSSSNVIIYGHDMKNGSMFGQLNKYEDYSFWNTAGNDVFYIYTENKVMQYRIFSVYISEPVSYTYNYNFTTLPALHSYADTVKKASEYDTGIDVSNASQIVTLSTCTGNGEQRLIVHGLFIGETSLGN
jgi:sortase B